MIKIGITGSIASGKTTASKILSSKRGPLFSADSEVKNLYSNRSFRLLLIKKFNIKNNSNLKESLKKKNFIKKDKYKKTRKNCSPKSKK